MHRGEIWRVGFPSPRGSEPGHPRPPWDFYDRSAINTVVVVPLTTTLRLADMPGNVLIRRRKSGLSQDSVANVSEVASVDRSWMTERLGAVTSRQLESVEEGLRLLLQL